MKANDTMKVDQDSRRSTQHASGEEVTVTTRADIREQIHARLEGKISEAALAKWAFDRFYAEEIGDEHFEAGAEPVIADALDALMFGDDPDFRLDEAQFHALLAQLREL